jgi:hypothetical protein
VIDCDSDACPRYRCQGAAIDYVPQRYERTADCNHHVEGLTGFYAPKQLARRLEDSLNSNTSFLVEHINDFIKGFLDGRGTKDFHWGSFLSRGVSLGEVLNDPWSSLTCCPVTGLELR